MAKTAGKKIKENSLTLLLTASALLEIKENALRAISAINHSKGPLSPVVDAAFAVELDDLHMKVINPEIVEYAGDIVPGNKFLSSSLEVIYVTSWQFASASVSQSFYRSNIEPHDVYFVDGILVHN